MDEYLSNYDYKYFFITKGNILEVEKSGEYGAPLDELNKEVLKALRSNLSDKKDLTTKPGLAVNVRKDFKDEIISVTLDHVGYEAGHYLNEVPITTVFEVILDKRHLTHTDEELEWYIKNFILSQCSDGWGEAYEQTAFYKNGDYEYYFSPWTPKSFVGKDEE